MLTRSVVFAHLLRVFFWGSERLPYTSCRSFLFLCVDRFCLKRSFLCSYDAQAAFKKAVYTLYIATYFTATEVCEPL
jgi:hypothetical protein